MCPGLVRSAAGVVPRWAGLASLHRLRTCVWVFSHLTATQCDGTKPTCSRCNSRQIPCVYNTGDDGRGTAQKSYVRLLQGRIALLEKILWLHSIDIHASTAQLMQQNLVPATITSLTASGSTAALDELCDTFEGTLTLDESQNFDQDGEARYFGPASGRLDFKPLNGRVSFLLFGALGKRH